MGLFGDLRKLSKQAKVASDGFDPVAQMREANSLMQRTTMQADLATRGTSASATILALNDAGALINNMAVIDADVTVMPSGAPPFASKLTLMGHAQMAGIQVGSTVDVLYDSNDLSTVALQP